MTRSVWKGPYVGSCFFRKKYKKKTKPLNVGAAWNIYSRNSTIMPQFVGQRVSVHNGQKFITIHLKEEMVGHKFGEFAFTRKKTLHKQKTRKIR